MDQDDHSSRDGNRHSRVHHDAQRAMVRVTVGSVQVGHLDNGK